MRKPVIANEISPKFDGVPSTDTLNSVLSIVARKSKEKGTKYTLI